jgi:hypothetical protein
MECSACRDRKERRPGKMVARRRRVDGWIIYRCNKAGCLHENIDMPQKFVGQTTGEDRVVPDPAEVTG